MSYDMTGLDPQLLKGLGLDRPVETKKNDELGQQDFLNLMIAQLRNQDPFNPMENGEFLGQIAQFGTVNGIQELQKSFESFSSSLQSTQALQAAGLVGRDVMVPSDFAVLGSGEADGVRGAVSVPSGTGEVLVGVFDMAGRLVRRISLGPQPPGNAGFHWDGVTDAGDRAAPGYYEIRSEAVSGGRAEALEVLVGARVESVTLGGERGGLSLRLAGLGEIDFSDVRHIA